LPGEFEQNAGNGFRALMDRSGVIGLALLLKTGESCCGGGGQSVRAPKSLKRRPLYTVICNSVDFLSLFYASGALFRIIPASISGRLENTPRFKTRRQNRRQRRGEKPAVFLYDISCLPQSFPRFVSSNVMS